MYNYKDNVKNLFTFKEESSVLINSSGVEIIINLNKKVLDRNL